MPRLPALSGRPKPSKVLGTMEGSHMKRNHGQQDQLAFDFSFSETVSAIERITSDAADDSAETTGESHVGSCQDEASSLS